MKSQKMAKFVQRLQENMPWVFVKFLGNLLITLAKFLGKLL